MRESELSASPDPIEEPKPTVSKKFIFSPSTEVEEHFDNKKFTFNDPLDLNHEYE